jgi:hypothetical protein
VAKPVLEKILVERYSPQRWPANSASACRRLITRAPDVPRLLHAWLQQQVEASTNCRCGRTTWPNSRASLHARRSAWSRRSSAPAC